MASVSPLVLLSSLLLRLMQKATGRAIASAKNARTPITIPAIAQSERTETLESEQVF